MARLDYHMDNRGLQRYLATSSDLRRVIRARAERGATIAKALVPSVSGTLRDSIHVEENMVRWRMHRWGPVMGALIISDVPYAAAVERGRVAYAQFGGQHFMSRMVAYLNVPK